MENPEENHEENWNLGDVENAFHARLQNLKKYRTNLNFLLIGYSGSGKSSLIRTLKSIYDRRLVTAQEIRVATNNTREQTTLNYKGYKLDDYVTLYDTQGFTELTSIENEYLEKWTAMIEGRVPDGTEFSKININGKSDKRRRIDLVIFLLSQKEGKYQMFKPIYTLALKRKIKCIFAASKLDKSLNLRQFTHMDCCYEGSQTTEYDEIYTRFEEIEIDENIYIVYNYDFTDVHRRSLNKEYTAYKLIEEGTRDFIEKPVRNDPFEDDYIIDLDK